MKVFFFFLLVAPTQQNSLHFGMTIEFGLWQRGLSKAHTASQCINRLQVVSSFLRHSKQQLTRNIFLFLKLSQDRMLAWQLRMQKRQPLLGHWWSRVASREIAGLDYCLSAVERFKLRTPPLL